jgi:hypothetical protein
MTCGVLAVRSENDTLELERRQERNAPESTSEVPEVEKKSLVVVYDGGQYSELVLKATSWLEHSGKFRVNLLSVNPRIVNEKSEDHPAGHQDYLSQLGVQMKEIQLDSENSGASADAVVKAIGAFNPDLVVMGASVGGFSVFNNIDFFALLDQLNCPVVIAKSFTIPGVHQAKSAILRLLRK